MRQNIGRGPWKVAERIDWIEVEVEDQGGEEFRNKQINGTYKDADKQSICTVTPHGILSL